MGILCKTLILILPYGQPREVERLTAVAYRPEIAARPRYVAIDFTQHACYLFRIELVDKCVNTPLVVLDLFIETLGCPLGSFNVECTSNNGPCSLFVPAVQLLGKPGGKHIGIIGRLPGVYAIELGIQIGTIEIGHILLILQ